MAASYGNMGTAYDSKGDYDEALQYHGKALQIRLKALGEKRGFAQGFSSPAASRRPPFSTFCIPARAFIETKG